MLLLTAAWIRRNEYWGQFRCELLQLGRRSTNRDLEWGLQRGLRLGNFRTTTREVARLIPAVHHHANLGAGGGTAKFYVISILPYLMRPIKRQGGGKADR
jgi:hypothetical protein